MLETILLASAVSPFSQPIPPIETLHPVRQELILNSGGYPQYRRGYRGLPYYSPDSVLRPHSKTYQESNSVLEERPYLRKELPRKS